MNSGWGSLPRHILGDILYKVKTQQDYLEFDLVCASWHRVATADEQRSRVNTLPRVPMLLVPSRKNHSHSLYNVITKRFSEFKLVVPHQGRFAGFSRGWLAAVEQDFSVTLYKAYPTLTNNKDDITAPATIRLPIVDDGPIQITRVALSADPLTNPNECIVMIIFGEWLRIAFVRPNKDTHWTRVPTPSAGFADILYLNNQFYVLGRYGMVISFKFTDDGANYLQEMKQDIFTSCRDVICGNLYLAESQGELILVRRWLKWGMNRKRKLNPRTTSDVWLDTLDPEKGGWVEMEDLSDVALFLGDNSSISISCLDFPRCKPGRIYFTHDLDGHGSTRVDDIGEYDLKDEMMRPFEIHTTTGIKMFPRVRSFPIWFVPNAQ